MAEVKLSIEEYHNVVKSLYTLIEKLYEMTKKCNDYKRQRDELINDIADIKRKAEAFDEIKEYTLDKIETLTTRKELASNFNNFEYFGNLLIAYKNVENKINDLERGSDDNRN
ncbi:hypothetical protein AB0L32_09375 [Micrococcus luteus]|uniref:hypothetical protein n=1 Tax=Micrococcus luteus TaxID=1270 RepID=UPI003426638D